MMKAAAGLGWTPSEFWGRTPHELLAWVEGHNERHGGGATQGMSYDELEALMERFPDE